MNRLAPLVFATLLIPWSPAAVSAGLLAPDRTSIPQAVGEDELQVVTRADLAAGVGAQMVVTVNGRLIASTLVSNTGYETKTFALASPLAAGDKVDLRFANDAVINNADRNLYVKQISSGGVTMLPTAPGVTYDLGGTAATAGDGVGLRAGQEAMYWAGAQRFTWTAAGTGDTGRTVSRPVPSDGFVAWSQVQGTGVEPTLADGTVSAVVGAGAGEKSRSEVFWGLKSTNEMIGLDEGDRFVVEFTGKWHVSKRDGFDQGTILQAHGSTSTGWIEAPWQINLKNDMFYFHCLDWRRGNLWEVPLGSFRNDTAYTIRIEVTMSPTNGKALNNVWLNGRHVVVNDTRANMYADMTSPIRFRTGVYTNATAEAQRASISLHEIRVN